jgi:hypothetical protein
MRESFLLGRVASVQLSRLMIPAGLGVCIPLAAAVALAAGGSPPMAAAGAGLVLLFWALDEAAAAVGRRGGVRQAVAASVGGVIVRYVVIGALLVAAGLLNRGGFLSCVLTFMALFTILLAVRIGRAAAAATHGRPS